jgi:FkbM family methyltransferase
MEPRKGNDILDKVRELVGGPLRMSPIWTPTRLLRVIRQVSRLYPFIKGRSRLGSRLSKRSPVKDGTVVTIDEGLEIELRSDDTVSGQLYWFGSFEVPETRFLAQTLKPGMTAFDIGAHIGTHTLLMAKRVGTHGTVFAFEPEQANFQLLRRNVYRNGFGDRVVLSQVAVAEAEGEAHLVLEGGSGNWLQVGSGEPRVTQGVMCTTIDAYVLQKGVARVDLIKTDTEGAEPLVLRGAAGTLDRFRPALLVEFAARHLVRYGSRPEELLDLLRRRKYSAFRLTRRAVRPLGRDDDISNTNLVFLPT